eukprot:s43_g40.t1
MACCFPRVPWRARKEGPRCPLFEREDYFTQVEPLLDLESKAALSQEAGISTVTFFRGAGGASAAAAALRERLQQVLRANPWVAGRVVRKPEASRLQLHFPAADAAEDADLMEEILHVDPPGLTVHPSMSYEEITSVVLGSSAVVQRLGGRFMLELPCFAWLGSIAKDALQTRITLVSDPNESDAFAMIFSMGHTTVDGSSYYQVLNMLSPDAEIVSLQVQRKHEASPRMIEAQGREDYEWMLSTLVAKALRDALKGPKARAVCFYVDDARMKAAKAAATEGSQVSFVSSNDVLVSGLAKMAEARTYAMAMNFRGRIEGLQATDAGNYEPGTWHWQWDESALILDSAVYGSPAKLREVLQQGPPYRTHGAPGEMSLGGCQQLLHLPLVPLGNVPFECSCIFRPTHGRLAVLAFTKRFGAEDFVRPSWCWESRLAAEPPKKRQRCRAPIDLDLDKELGELAAGGPLVLESWEETKEIGWRQKLKQMQMEGMAFISRQLQEQATMKAAEREEQRRVRESSDRDAQAAFEEEKQKAVERKKKEKDFAWGRWAQVWAWPQENADFLQQQINQKTMEKRGKEQMTEVEQAMNKERLDRAKKPETLQMVAQHKLRQVGAAANRGACYVKLVEQGKAVLLKSLTAEAAQRALDQLTASGFVAKVEPMPDKAT